METMHLSSTKSSWADSLGMYLKSAGISLINVVVRLNMQPHQITYLHQAEACDRI